MKMFLMLAAAFTVGFGAVSFAGNIAATSALVSTQ